MFWKFNLITTSHVETLLSKEEVTLGELMDEGDILQECKAQNKKLIDFLVLPEIMEEMITLITQEPPVELDEVVRYKYSNIACEILTSDVCAINDTLAGDHGLLCKLLAFLEPKGKDGPLNPLLASFFSKTLGLLVSRKTQPMFEFLLQHDEFVPLLLDHLETSAIMDLLLRLVTCTDNNESRYAMVKWLSDQHLVERLVSMIRPDQSEERSSNAAQALCDIVRVSREHMSLLQEKADPDPLLGNIESSETISKLLENMFDGEKTECVLVSGILVILALLEFKKQGPAGQHQLSGQSGSPSNRLTVQGSDSCWGPENPLQCFASFFNIEGPEMITTLDAERLSQGVAQVIAALKPRLSDLTQLLKNPPQKPSYSNIVVQPVEQPVGWTRLEVAHLISALLTTNKHTVNQRLTELSTVPSLLDLFFKHSWNNFLHTQVEQAIGNILRNAPTSDAEDNMVHPLLNQVFCECKIVQRLLDAWEENEQEQSQPGKHRRGYMGHLTNIANHLIRNSEQQPNSDLIKSSLEGLPTDYKERWEIFVADTMAEINKRNQTPLVSGVPLSILEASSAGFHELHVPFQHEKQAFTDYQMENMTNSFVDQFGFHDNEFVETDESISDRLSRVAGNFQLHAEDHIGSSELFQKTCREHIPSLGDEDSDEEVWEDKEITFGPGVSPPNPLCRLTAQASSSFEESSSDSEGDDCSSDSTHMLSHCLARVAVSTPDAGNIVTGPPSTNLITSPGVQGSLAHQEAKMETASSDPWGSPFFPNNGSAETTSSSPWSGAGVVVGSDIPATSKRTQDQCWADFSCFGFPSSQKVPESQVPVDASRSCFGTEGTSQSATMSTFKVESQTSFPTLGSQSLANGKVPVVSSGPAVVLVGPTAAAPVDELQPQKKHSAEISPPHTCPATPPPSPVACNKLGDDPAKLSMGALSQLGSLVDGNSVPSASNPPAGTVSSSPSSCVQNGPII